MSDSGNTTPNPGVRADYLNSLALQACIYCWPLYEMQRMRAATSARKAPGQGFAGTSPESTERWCNLFTNERALLTAGKSRVVMPNNDTLYVNAWLDLSKGPLVISVPDTGTRYYVLGMLDYYTNPFASVGTRTTGNGAGSVLVSGPGWEGEIPAEHQAEGRHLCSPTNGVWIIGRILVDGPDDVPAVNALQDQFRMQALADWRAGRDSPPSRFDSQFAPRAPFTVDRFLAMVNGALKDNPPPARDAALVAQFAQLGIGKGAKAALQDDARTALVHACARAQRLLDSPEQEVFGAAGGSELPGWRNPFRLGQNFGDDLLLRAFIARQSIGALETREAAYPRCETDVAGQLLSGRHRYTIRFAPGQTPPVDAFWSITLYRASDCFLVPNPIERYSIGDRTPGLVFDTDGGLTITIAHAAPLDATQRANWLPAPEDRFFLCLRAYLPRPEMLDGHYRLPDPQRRPD
ncbi:DUF1254 domain-containing protein [Comamonadaceae bacterium G21597-S1]|nr:DUF1254 domain-containing protein [Comamonadaceae bacterium G21597-S1]